MGGGEVGGRGKSGERAAEIVVRIRKGEKDLIGLLLILEFRRLE